MNLNRNRCCNMCLVVVFIAVLSMICNAQKSNVDSLLLITQEGNDVEKVTALLHLSDVYKYDSVKLARQYIEEALSISGKIKNDTLTVNSINYLGPVLVLQNDLDSAFAYYKQALSISEKVDYIKGLGSTYNHIASYYYSKSNLDSAIFFYKKAISNIQKMNDIKRMAKLYNNIGIMYYKLMQKDSSLLYFIKSLEMKEKVLPSGKPVASDNELTASIINIGLFYYGLKDYEQAIIYLTRAEKLSTKTGNSNYNAIARVNLGIVYNLAEQYDSAEYYHLSAIDQSLKMKNEKLLSQSYTGLGNLYKNTNKPDNAIEFFSKSLALKAKFNDIRGKAIVEKDMAELYLKTGDIGKASIFAKLALEDALASKNVEIEYAVYGMLADIYKEEHDYKKAYDFQVKYDTMKDSIDAVANKNLIADMQTKYETEKKNLQIEKLKLSNFEIDSKRKNNRLLAMTMASGLILLLIFFWLRVRTNRLLKLKNEQLQNLNATQNKLMSIISHYLKAPLSAFYSITNSLKSKFEKIDKQEINHYFSRMLSSSVALKLQLENMLNWSIGQTRNISVSLKEINIHILTTRVIIVLQEFANEKNVEIENQINEDLVLKTDDKLLGIVLNNLISNAVKFSKIDNKVLVKGQRIDGKTIISVQDFGVGMTPDVAESLFFGTETTKKNENSDTGLGLIVSKELVEKLNGKISVKSELNKGTEIIIEFT